MLNLLCLSPSSRQWRYVKKCVQDGLDKNHKDLKVPKKSNDEKLRDTKIFIMNYRDRLKNYSPDGQSEDLSDNEVVIPFETVTQFYNYYVDTRKSEGKWYVSPKTFKAAFDSDELSNVSCSRRVGTFRICELCLAANELLSKTKKESEKKLINNYFYKHLETQQKQRDAMERAIEESKALDDNKQPVKAFVLSDAITKYRGDCPQFRTEFGKLSKFDDSKKSIGDRMFGSLVVCGPVKAFLIFHCHDFVGGGSNVAIEVLRLSLLKLTELLAPYKMNLPFDVQAQFDNCGENKNKIMNGYLSLLVELDIFFSIRVSFLIVGHTHCIIDQYFSSISKIMRKCLFIATPYAIEELLDVERNTKFQNPAAQTHVHAVYDVKKALKPYINEAIKHFQVLL